MKKYHWYLLTIIMVITTSFGLLSCGDDNNDNSNNSKARTTVGVLDSTTGLRFKSVSSYSTYSYNYDYNGLLDYIDNNSSMEEWEFIYNPNKIIYNNRYNNEEMTYSVTYNSAGYLSRMDGSGFNKSGALSEQADFSYDSNGHIIKIVSNYEDYRENNTITYTYTWNNDLLEQEVCILRYEEADGGYGTETETTTYSYSNNSFRNVYRQWTTNITGEHYLNLFALVGLLGVGPTMLPSNAVFVEENTENGKTEKPVTHNRTYTYGFNADGTVSYSEYGSLRYNYTYEHINDNN